MLIPGLCFITLVLYSVLRLFFLLWNTPLFHDASSGSLLYAFLLGLRFDLLVICLLATPALALKIFGDLLRRDQHRLAGWFFLFCQIPFLILNFVDIQFFNFMGRRFMGSSILIAKEVEGKFWPIMWSYKYLFGTCVVSLVVYVLVSLFWIRRTEHFFARPSLSRKWLSHLFVVLVIALSIRGGFQSKPLNIAHAQVFSNANLSALVLNSSFTFIKSLNKQSLPREHYMTEEKMLSLVNGHGVGACAEELPRFSKKQNVVLIALESFSLDHMGQVHGDKGFTPFLDELAGKSLFFTNAFANGRRSIEGITALLGGIPALMNEPFVKSQFITNEFYGWGKLIGQDEYTSTFYHGGANGTMFFDTFTAKAGFQRYYGSNEYPDNNDNDGVWGIWDEPFLLNMIKDIDQQKKPFTAAVLTLSSHNPFLVPEKYKNHFPKGSDAIHEVVGYSDEALRLFFEEAKKHDWYNDTLFVITADHTYTAGNVRPRYINEIGNYRIPILFFHPQINKWPAVDTQEPIQQIDVLPSVLDFLGKKPSVANFLGRSVFCKGPRYATIYLDKRYWLITRDHVLFVNPELGHETTLLENNFIPSSESKRYFGALKSPLEEAAIDEDLFQKSLATRQYFSEGLWNNKLYYPVSEDQTVR